MALYDEFELRVSEKYIVVSPKPGGRSLVFDRADAENERLSFQDSPPETPAAKVSKIYGLVGIIRLLAGPYLVCVTKRECIGDVPKRLWRVSGTQVLRVASSPALSAQQARDEEAYLALVEQMLAVPAMHFAYDWDATFCAQRAATIPKQLSQAPFWQRADERFFWNHALVEPLVRAEAHQWVIPMFMGFAEACEMQAGSGKFSLALVSRRSRARAGTRLFVRGVDEMGAVANFVETEQIVRVGSSLSSFVQIRGSIPVFWTQLPDLKYKPRPKLSRSSAVSGESFKRHFDEVLTKHGAVTCVNLVDHKGGELLLADEYNSQVQRLGSDRVHYVAFDFHKECKKSTARLSVLISSLQKDLDDYGFFFHDGDAASSPVLQMGTFRTNCVDNLDRTNVVQSLLALSSLERQLRRLGLLGATESLTGNKKFEFAFKNVWANNADRISTQYSGTNALKNDITRTGKRTLGGMKDDGTNSLVRYWLNNFSDGRKQDAYNLFLGYYRPSKSAPSPFAGTNVLAACFVVAAIAVLLAVFALCFFAPDGYGARSAAWGAVIVIAILLLQLAKKNGRSLVNNPRLVGSAPVESRKKAE